MDRLWYASISLRLLGLIQLGLCAALISPSSFGGMLLGFLPLALIIGGKGLGNLFTRSR